MKKSDTLPSPTCPNAKHHDLTDSIDLKNVSWTVVAHAFNPSSQEVEAGRSL